MILKEAQLFVAHFEKGEYTPEEYAAFVGWLDGASIEDLGVIADEHEALQAEWRLSSTGPSAQWIEHLELKLDRADRLAQAPVRSISGERRIGKRYWAVAASLLVLLSSGAFWWFAHQSATHSIAGNNLKEVLSNIASTTRGQQKELLLPDGSKVWLNDASTLKYPVSFTGRERDVELSGEAFFEVAKNAAMPFKVKVRDIQIEVLGTHFNVMGYPDEPTSKTTLVEGVVKISRGDEAYVLQPGEQAEVAYPKTGGISPMKLTQGVDAEMVIAWKNGALQFNNDDIYTVLREISRAYKVDFQYEKNLPTKEFSGSFSRDASLDQVLEQLKTQNINFKTIKNSNTIVVTP